MSSEGRIHAALTKMLRLTLRQLGLQVSRDRTTLLVPRPQPGPPRFSCAGIDWNLPQIEAILQGPLADFADEVNALPARPGPGGQSFFSENPYFGFVDAAICYALVRARKPSLVFEVGSGFSSRLIRLALERNATGRLVCVDPAPRADLEQVADEHLAVRIETLPPDRIRELPADAVLFIDSSHRAGTGSDVNHLFLEILPGLPPGILVHVHDIFLPEDYPRSWNIERGFYYSEQYLLHALLCFSRGFRIVWPGRWILRNRPDDLARHLRPGEDLERHCSFWFERVDELRERR